MAFRENIIKIIATLGPVSDSKEMIKKLIDSGVDVFRLNFSHGTHDEKRKLVRKIREIDDYIAILADIQGPKIRVGKFENDETYYLTSGQTVKVYEKEIIGNNEQFSIPLEGFLNSVEEGDIFYINDGIIKIRIKDKNNDHIIGDVLTGGNISTNKGVNIPTGDLHQKIPTEKDIKDLELIADLDIDYVAISFVSDGDDVLHVRRILDNYGNDGIKLIAKIERPIALDNFDQILDVSDGIMIARGDLGVEITPDKVPLEQKKLIHKCNKEGKLVIVATQMLESMINAPIPTRAEAADVFNAVLDGTDAVMLSAETAIGKYPLKAVKFMNDVAYTANEYMPKRIPDVYDSERLTHTQTVGHAIYSLANEMEDLNFRGKILIITRGGYGVKMTSKYRPPLPIIAITPSKKTSRELHLVWGVHPYHIENIDFFNMNAEEIIEQSVKFAVDNKALYENEHVIILLVSRKFQRRGNLIGFYYVGEILENASKK
ncbi:MAG: pyruvate kinase [Candidatus Lokiarchaeota archaeon]|nr:pyruvate kinase [Candidatus Lokiarchaeota archaeon]